MKVGLVLEGGGMRGLFTSGVLDVMLDNNIDIDGIIGVSSGALFGPNYFSKQKGRVVRYITKYASDKRFASIRNLIFTGNIVSKRFAYYKLQTKLDKFDNEEFIKSGKKFIAVATDVETGEAEYFQITDPYKDMEKLRASSSIPLVSRMVKINNKKYLDGAISDSIPINKFIEEGYDKIIVILTRPKGYRKTLLEKRKRKLINSKYKKYPLFVKAVRNRYRKYNKTLDMIEDLEKSNKIFVIAPLEDINIKLTEKNTEKLKGVYTLGVSEAIKVMDDLKIYLK